MKIKAMQVRDGAFQLKFRDGDAGIDVALPYGFETEQVGPQTIKIPLGWAFEMEEGWHMLALQKSRHAGRMLVEAPLIDNSYRGEIHALLRIDMVPELEAGDYVLQLFPVWSLPFTIQVVDAISETERGDGAFGSTMEEGPEQAKD